MQYLIDQQTMDRARLLRIAPCFQSWDLPEYITACNVSTLWDSIQHNFSIHADRIEALSEKHFYAGGSARWMFQKSIQDVQLAIDQKLNSAADVSVVVQHLKGEAAPDAINSLCQQRRNRDGVVRHFFISQYAIRRATEWADGAMVKLFVQHAEAIGNDAIKGWAFEMRCLFDWKQLVERRFTLSHIDSCVTATVPHVKTCLTQDVPEGVTDSSHTLVWNGPESICTLDRHGFISCAPTGAMSNILIVPKLWNHGCFDCIFWLRGQKEIWFVSATVSDSHSRKLRFIQDVVSKLLEADRPDRVHLVTMVPDAAIRDQFKYKAPLSSAADAPVLYCWVGSIEQ
jgi:hypothetical protein